MNRKLFFSIFLVALTLLTACKNGKMLGPVASGRPYEVLVVIDNNLWENPNGRALFNVLDTDIPGLPQPERSFHISQCSPKDFNRTLNLFRNIIIVDINPQMFTRVRMKFTRNEYAQEQIILRVNAPTEQAFAAYVTEHSQDIIDFITKMEMNRLCVNLKERHSGVTYELAKELFDCEFFAPDELKNYKKGTDFFWTSNNTASGMVNICMYSYDYEGPETFNKKYILAKRDSIMEKNLPGSAPGMYMQTDTLCTTITPIMVHGGYAMEARGLWFMKNDGMGGPFVSHSRVDTENNRVIVVEGFVFAPEKMKRGLMRRLEGSLYTLNLPQETASEISTALEEEQVKK